MIGVLLSVAMPLSNVRSNFKDADQSGNHEPALFHVALFTQLPRRAALVVEDYASDMALSYSTSAKLRSTRRKYRSPLAKATREVNVVSAAICGEIELRPRRDQRKPSMKPTAGFRL